MASLCISSNSLVSPSLHQISGLSSRERRNKVCVPLHVSRRFLLQVSGRDEGGQKDSSLRRRSSAISAHAGNLSEPRVPFRDMSDEEKAARMQEVRAAREAETRRRKDKNRELEFKRHLESELKFGKYLMAQEMYEAAMAHFDKVMMSSAPESLHLSDATYQKAVCLQRLGGATQAAEARALLRELIEVHRSPFPHIKRKAARALYGPASTASSSSPSPPGSSAAGAAAAAGGEPAAAAGAEAEVEAAGVGAGKAAHEGGVGAGLHGEFLRRMYMTGFGSVASPDGSGGGGENVQAQVLMQQVLPYSLLLLAPLLLLALLMGVKMVPVV
eukprot:jgi/Mesen1/8033/ME000428S07237